MDFILNAVDTGSPELNEHLEHVRKFDWASTSVGPIASWPRDLLQLVHVMMLERGPRTIMLGDKNRLLYNPAYAVNVAGDRHPKALGRTQAEVWSPELARMKDEYSRPAAEAERFVPYAMSDFHLTRTSGAVIENAVLSWTMIPLAGGLNGYYVSFEDVTAAYNQERRAKTLKTVSESCENVQDMPSLWHTVTQTLSSNPQHYPFAFFYSIEDASSATSQTGDEVFADDKHVWICNSAVGDFDDGSSVKEVACKAIADSPAARQAVNSTDMVVLKSDDESYPNAWGQAAGKRGYSDTDQCAVVYPLRMAGSVRHQADGLMVLGLNTRIPLNEAYRAFVQDTVKIFNSAAERIRFTEAQRESLQESKRVAELEEKSHEYALATRQKEAKAVTEQLERLLTVVQLSDVGIFEFSHNGTLLQANDAYHRDSGLPRLEPGQELESMAFMDYVYEEDRALARSKWESLVKGTSTTFEMRWKSPPDAEDQDGVWILAACTPVMDENGVFTSISGCTTNIQSQKRFQNETLRRANALERARVSEEEAVKLNRRLLRLQDIIDAIEVGIYEYDANGCLISSNDAYHTISGIPKVNGALAFSDACYPDDHEYMMSKWADLVEGKSVTFEMRWKAPLNEFQEDYRWIIAASIPGFDESGAVNSVFGCITDLSAQKRSEAETKRRVEALERAEVLERRFYRFTEAAPVAIYICNSEQDTIYCNEKFYSVTGHARVDYSGIDWSNIVYREDSSVVAKMWRDIEAGKPATSQFRLQSLWNGGDGPAGQAWVMATMLPELENGSLKQVIGTMTEISHLKWAESIQKSRVDEAIEAKRQQENFIDMTSHEIRNPLGVVVHCADSITDSLLGMKELAAALIDSPTKEKAIQLQEHIADSVEAVNTIKNCSSHQKRIVDDILVLSKLDSNLLQISPSAVRAKDILMEIERMFDNEAKAAEVVLTTDSDPSMTRLNVDWLQLDHGRINQILINLITNSIKFVKNKNVRDITIRMGAGEQRPSAEELSVDFARAQSLRDTVFDTPEFAANQLLYLWFSVQDTGRGMTKQEKDKIFSRFQQGSPRTYSEYGGSGLGLFITHSLVGLQGGEIGVASEAGVGSTFAFFVKTCRCAAPKPEVRGLPLRSNGLPFDPSATQGAHGKTSQISVLVVEDNLLNQKVLEKQLARAGYEVNTADHGQEALDFIMTTRHWKGQESSGKKVDVILMDIEMPVMNGLVCAKTIRELQKSGKISGHLPIIAVSANARAEQTNQAKAAGMDDAISKPFRIPDLIPKIDRLCKWAKG